MTHGTDSAGSTPRLRSPYWFIIEPRLTYHTSSLPSRSSPSSEGSSPLVAHRERGAVSERLEALAMRARRGELGSAARTAAAVATLSLFVRLYQYRKGASLGWRQLLHPICRLSSEGQVKQGSANLPHAKKSASAVASMVVRSTSTHNDDNGNDDNNDGSNDGP